MHPGLSSVKAHRRGRRMVPNQANARAGSGFLALSISHSRTLHVLLHAPAIAAFIAVSYTHLTLPTKA